MKPSPDIETMSRWKHRLEMIGLAAGLVCFWASLIMLGGMAP